MNKHDFLTMPHSFTRSRRSAVDSVRDACAIHTFKRRMPASEKALYIVAVLAVIVLIGVL